MRILIADDEPRVRSALRLLLEQEPGVSVIAEVCTVRDLLVQTRTALPDLVLLDWSLPGLEAACIIPALRAARPGLLVIAVDGLLEDGRAALAAGADGFISRGDSPERLVAALGNCRPHGRELPHRA